MASKLKKSVAELLNRAQLAINNTLNDSQILDRVAAYGYDEEKMLEGRARFEAAQASYNAKEAAAGAQYDAHTLDAPVGRQNTRDPKGNICHLTNTCGANHIDCGGGITPNHLHGVIIIEAPSRPGHPLPTPRRGVATTHLRHWKSGSLGAMINQSKSTCTKRIRSSMSSEFAWQPRFYDHIIRNEHDLARIRGYIRNDPAQWALDANHPGA